jgi:hypothetical protein
MYLQHNVSGLLGDVLMIFSLSSCWATLYRWLSHVGSNLIPSAARADEICYIMLQILNSSGKGLLVAEDATWSEI